MCVIIIFAIANGFKLLDTEIANLIARYARLNREVNTILRDANILRADVSIFRAHRGE